MNSVKTRGNMEEQGSTDSTPGQLTQEQEGVPKPRGGDQLSGSRGARPQATGDLEHPGVYHHAVAELQG